MRVKLSRTKRPRRTDLPPIWPKMRKARAKPSKDKAGVEAPLTTPDGMTWLDPDGNPPVLDSKGRLAKPFVFRLPPLSDGTLRGKELWGVGLVLPLTPQAHAEWAAQVEADRAKKEGRRAHENGASSTLATPRKKGQRSDEGLSPEQLAKRNKRRARREARKRRRAQG